MHKISQILEIGRFGGGREAKRREAFYLNLGGRSQLVGRVRGRPPSGRVQRRARAASRGGGLAIDIVAVGFVSDALVIVAATVVLFNGLTKSALRTPAALPAAAQLINFSSSSSIASRSLPLSPASPPPPSSPRRPRQPVLWQWAGCSWRSARHALLGSVGASGRARMRLARARARRQGTRLTERRQRQCRCRRQPRWRRSQGGCSAGIGAAAARNQAASQAADTAEAWPLPRQGRGSGGLGGLGGRCDRSRSA
jgi:hypothetical protein